MGSVRRVLVVGAGPMGLAAALGAARRGHDVTVFEKNAIGSSLREWGRARFFTPVGRNLSSEIRKALGPDLPPEEALLTGPEMVEQVLEPLAASPLLRGRIRTGCRVVAIGRAGLLRGDFVGHPLRSERPFRVLVDSGGGQEFKEADIVFDASGGHAIPAAAGAGGIPAAGEDAVASSLVRDLGALDRRLEGMAGKSILVVGHGHSAATAMLSLADAASRFPGTRLTWAVRTGNRRPCEEVADDPLPERRRVVSAANALAESPPPGVTVVRRTGIAEMGLRNGRFFVRFSREGEGTFDEVIALTGFRPDLGFLSELALDISGATEGPAPLSRALAGATDCLSVPRVGAQDLETGESGFFFVGSKSYGRRRTFLLQTGFAQLDLILASLPEVRA